MFGVVVVLFGFSFPFQWLFPLAQTALVAAGALTLADIVLLFNPSFRIISNRQLPKVLSLGDENNVYIHLTSTYSIPLRAVLIDELPIQFQQRNFALPLQLKPYDDKRLTYRLRPVERGSYQFEAIHVFVSSLLGIVERRFRKEITEQVPVYPSVIQMKDMELKAFARISQFQGIKKMRRIGHSYEFEQIKEYVHGDDYRSINWKATSRRDRLMVNQYEDERSQQIYSVIDKSRNMKMPFDGLSLFDYAINASLVISNIALRRHDKAGLLTFSDKIGTTIKADRNANQLRLISEALYQEKERNLESNYELLYYSVRNFVKNRSMLILYTNFESMYACERVLPILRKINALHLLIVVFFENTEVDALSMQKVGDVQGIYLQTIAQKFLNEKQMIVQKLRQFGIQSILTPPEKLNVEVVNKYLEMKSRGMI